MELDIELAENGTPEEGEGAISALWQSNCSIIRPLKTIMVSGTNTRAQNLAVTRRPSSKTNLCAKWEKQPKTIFSENQRTWNVYPKRSSGFPNAFGWWVARECSPNENQAEQNEDMSESEDSKVPYPIEEQTFFERLFQSFSPAWIPEAQAKRSMVSSAQFGSSGFDRKRSDFRL